MIRDDLFSFAFLRKQAFFGSFRGMRYRIAKEGDELIVSIWPEPFAWAYTPEEEKEQASFPFSEEGYEQAKDFLENRSEVYSGGNT